MTASSSDRACRRGTAPLGRVTALVAALVLVAGCAGGGDASSSPSPTASPTATPRATATPAPATAAPTLAPSPNPTVAADCPIVPETGRLPSDRMVDVAISTTDTADLVTFMFGNPSIPPPPQGPSEGSLDAAIPPYTEGASGLPIDVTGQHVAQVKFAGMSLSNDVGQPTYDGRMDFRPGLPTLKSVIAYEMFEGIIGWYIGYDGNGCVTLSSDATSVTVAVAHPVN